MKNHFSAIISILFCLASPTAASPRITGSFIQLNATNSKAGQEYWNGQLSEMAKLGMDTVVVQYVAYDRFYHYPTKIEGMVPAKKDVIMEVLNAARSLKIKVFLGMQLDGDFWKQKFDLEKRIAMNIATMNELHARYGAHAGLGGWYFPEEIDDETAGREYADDLLEYLARLTARAREFTKLPVMISPFFSKEVNTAAYAKWWDEVALPKTKINIVAMQDGVGTHRVSLSDLEPVYSALSPVMKRHGVQFWSNAEIFDQTAGWPVNNEAWAAQPAAFQRVLEQIIITEPFTAKTISFEYTHYMDSGGSPRAIALFEAYQQYIIDRN